MSQDGRKPRVVDDDLLDALAGADAPVLSTAEIAESLPIKRRATLNRLRKLENAGKVASKTIGGRNTVWWLIEPEEKSRPDFEEGFGSFAGSGLADQVAQVREDMTEDFEAREYDLSGH